MEVADSATLAASAAAEAIAAKIIATELEALPPMAAGTALAQVPAGATAPPPRLVPIAPLPVTPGAGGGGCTGSPC